MLNLLNKIELTRINKSILQGLIGLSGIKLAQTAYKYDHGFKKSTLNATLLLPGKGCAWAKQKDGGCTMCGFNNALSSLGINRSFSDAEMLQLFDLGMSQLNKKHPKVLNIYNAGSFLNDSEIAYELQKTIMQRVKENSDIEVLFIESRPEFVTAERMSDLLTKLKPKTLKIGIGLESENDRIRNEYINKGITKESYEKAIKTAKQAGIRTLTYILIKPLFLSEKEAIGEAITTARYAFKVGSDEVSFESCCIQKGTKMEGLYNQSKYRTPWLWSIIEVIKATHNLGNIQVGSFWDFPLPLAKPHNCPKCSADTEKLLGDYRVNHNLDIFSKANCSCQEEWRRAIS
jgi:hypothetical protein